MATLNVEEKGSNFFMRILKGFVMWFDSDADNGTEMTSEKVNWVRCIPFIIIHLAAVSAIWVGWSLIAVITAVVIYFIQMFAITGFYHRYFSHKSFKTNRFLQFIFAVIGGAAVQKGAMWWAAHHRHHHRHSDDEHDVHSPTQRGFWWSHVGWITADKYFQTNYKLVPDLIKFPELRLINRFDIFIPVVVGTLIFFFGYGLNFFFPQLGTGGTQMLVWGYFVSTVFCWHGTFTINSLSHVWGKQRFKTSDTSRNNFILSLITLGEGWHNNHHRFPASTRQGFYWWEVDFTFYVLKLMSKFGLVWDLKEVPDSIYEEAKKNKLEEKVMKKKVKPDSILDEPFSEKPVVAKKSKAVKKPVKKPAKKQIKKPVKSSLNKEPVEKFS